MKFVEKESSDVEEGWKVKRKAKKDKVLGMSKIISKGGGSKVCRVRLTWEIPRSNGYPISHFTVERMEEVEEGVEGEEWQVVGRGKVPEYIDTVELGGAQSGKFRYRVRATNRLGQGPWSEESEVAVRRQGTLRGAGGGGEEGGRAKPQLPTILAPAVPLTITSGTMGIIQSQIDVTKLKRRTRKVKRS